MKAAQASALLGTTLILTGIRPEVARTLVDQNVDLSSVRILGSLATAIAAVLDPQRAAPPPR